MPRQLVASREPSVAFVHWAGVRPLVDRRLGGTVGVFPGSDWHEADGHGRLLVDLRQDLVALAGRLVELCQGGVGLGD